MADNKLIQYLVKFRLDDAQVKEKIASLDNEGKKLNKTFQRVGKIGFAAVAAGAAVATAALTKMAVETVKVGANFENAMYVLASIRGVGVESLKSLEDQSRLLGSTTLFTATQAAEGMAQLARAGLETQEIIYATGDALNFAGANFVSMKTATTLTAATMKQFGLQAHDAGRIVDTFTVAAQKSLFDVEGLAVAMRYGGSAGSSLGASLEETVAMLAQFRDLGLESSMAGVRFRQSMLALSAPTYKAKKALAALNIPLEEVNPSIVGLEAAFKRLGQAGLTADQLVPIVNKISAADVAKISEKLYGMAEASDDATGAVGEMVKTMEETRGVTSRTYEMVKQSTSSQFKILKSAFQELQITIFDMLKGGPTGAEKSFQSLADVIEGVKAVVESITLIFKTQGDYIQAELSSIFGEFAGGLKENADMIAASIVNATFNLIRMAKNFYDLIPLLFQIGKIIAGWYLAAKFQVAGVAALKFIGGLTKLIPALRTFTAWVAVSRAAMAGPVGLAIGIVSVTASLYAFEASLKKGTTSADDQTKALERLRMEMGRRKDKTEDTMTADDVAHNSAINNLMIRLEEEDKLNDKLKGTLNGLKNVTLEQAKADPSKYFTARIKAGEEYEEVILNHAAATRLAAVGEEDAMRGQEKQADALQSITNDINKQIAAYQRFLGVHEENKEAYDEVAGTHVVGSMYATAYTTAIRDIAHLAQGNSEASETYTETMGKMHDTMYQTTGQVEEFMAVFEGDISGAIDALNKPLEDSIKLHEQFTSLKMKEDKNYGTIEKLNKGGKKAKKSVGDLNKELKKLLDELIKIRDTRIELTLDLKTDLDITLGKITAKIAQTQKKILEIGETAQNEIEKAEKVQEIKVRGGRKGKLSQEQKDELTLRRRNDEDTLEAIEEYFEQITLIQQKHGADKAKILEESEKVLEDLRKQYRRTVIGELEAEYSQEFATKKKQIEEENAAISTGYETQLGLLEDAIKRGGLLREDGEDKLSKGLFEGGIQLQSFATKDFKTSDVIKYEIESYEDLMSVIRETRQLRAENKKEIDRLSGKNLAGDATDAEIEQLKSLRLAHKLQRADITALAAMRAEFLTLISEESTEEEKLAAAKTILKKKEISATLKQKQEIADLEITEKRALLEKLKQATLDEVKQNKDAELTAQQEGYGALLLLYQEYLEEIEKNRSNFYSDSTNDEDTFQQLQESTFATFIARRSNILTDYLDLAGKVEDEYSTKLIKQQEDYLKAVDKYSDIELSDLKSTVKARKLIKQKALIDELANQIEMSATIADIEKRRTTELKEAIEPLKLKIEVNDKEVVALAAALEELINRKYDLEIAGVVSGGIEPPEEPEEIKRLKDLSVSEIFSDKTLPKILLLYKALEKTVFGIAKGSRLVGKAMTQLYAVWPELGKAIEFAFNKTKEFVEGVLDYGVIDSAIYGLTVGWVKTTQAIKDAGNEVKNFVKDIPGVEEDVNNVKEAITDWGDKSIWEKVGAGLEVTVNSLQLISKIVAGGSLKALGDVFGSLVSKLGNIKVEDFTKAWAKVKIVASVATQAIASAFKTLSDITKKVAESVLSSISFMTGGLDLSLSGIMGLIQGGGQAVLDDAEAAAERLKELDDKLAAGDITQEEYDEAREAGVGDANPAEAANTFIEDTFQQALDFIDALVAAAPIVVQKIVDKIPSLISALVDAIPVVVQALLQNIVPLISTLATGLIEIIPVLLNAIITELPNLVTQLINLIVTQLPILIDGLLAGVLGLVEAFFTPAEEGAKSLFQQLIEALVPLIGKIIEAVATAIAELITKIPDIILVLLQALPTILTSLLKGITVIVKALLDMIPVLIDYLIQELPTILQALLDGLLLLIIQIAESLPILLTKLLELVPQLIGAVIALAGDLIVAIVKAIPTVLMALIEGLPDLITQLVKSFPEMVILLTVELIKAIPEIVVVLVKEILFKLPEIAWELAKAVFEGIVMGIWELLKAIGQLFADVISEIISFGTNETETFGDTPGAIQAGTDGLLARFAPNDYVIAAQDPVVAATQAMDLLAKGTRGAIASSISPLVSGGMGGGDTTASSSSQTQINLAVVADGRVLDSIQVNAMNNGNAPKLKRKIRTASGFKTGFSRKVS